jgi:hypothetical protein
MGFVVARDGDGRGRPLAVRVVKVRARVLSVNACAQECVRV